MGWKSPFRREAIMADLDQNEQTLAILIAILLIYMWFIIEDEDNNTSTYLMTLMYDVGNVSI